MRSSNQKHRRQSVESKIVAMLTEEARYTRYHPETASHDPSQLWLGKDFLKIPPSKTIIRIIMIKIIIIIIMIIAMIIIIIIIIIIVIIIIRV